MFATAIRPRSLAYAQEPFGVLDAMVSDWLTQRPAPAAKVSRSLFDPLGQFRAARKCPVIAPRLLRDGAAARRHAGGGLPGKRYGNSSRCTLASLLKMPDEMIATVVPRTARSMRSW